ncbi:MAG TPA: CheR family methyltransferase [Nannocystaceae bacterium]|nr:CheR family methyltransferase [Nannocystaceae bacterium]
MPEPHNQAFEDLLAQMKRAGGYDFTHYKRASVGRGVDRRMRATQTIDYGAYGSYLDAHPAEYALLFSALLVNVTEFFRDPLAWDALRTGTLPQVMHDSRERPQLRVWSIGCAAGQEPYSIAMLLAEAMGPAAFADRVKIYATDRDDDALVTARRGRYDDASLARVPHALRERWFHGPAHAQVIDGALRRAVVFARHDVLVDPPLPRIDLLVFRNTLMYFRAATQTDVLTRLHRSLAATGFLFLGRSELLLGESDRFAAHDVGHGVFSKVTPAGPARADEAVSPPRVAAPTRSDLDLRADNARLRHDRAELTSLNAWLAATVDSLGSAVAIVDREGCVRVWNRGAQTLWGLPAAEAHGRELQELAIDAPLDALHHGVREVLRTRTRAALELAACDRHGRALRCHVFIAPLPGQGAGAVIVMDPIEGARSWGC